MRRKCLILFYIAIILGVVTLNLNIPQPILAHPLSDHCLDIPWPDVAHLDKNTIEFSGPPGAEFSDEVTISASVGVKKVEYFKTDGQTSWISSVEPNQLSSTGTFTISIQIPDTAAPKNYEIKLTFLTWYSQSIQQGSHCYYGSETDVLTINIEVLSPDLVVNLKQPEPYILCKNGNFVLPLEATVTNEGDTEISDIFLSLPTVNGTTPTGIEETVIDIGNLPPNTPSDPIKVDAIVNDYIKSSETISYTNNNNGKLPKITLVAEASAAPDIVVKDKKEGLEPGLDKPEQYLNTEALSVHHSPDPGKLPDDPASMFIHFSPKCGDKNSDNTLPIKTLEFALEIDHFNWEQIITVPSNFEVYHLEGAYMDSIVDTNVITTTNPMTVPLRIDGTPFPKTEVTGPIYDPVVQFPTAQSYGLRIDGAGVNDVAWVVLETASTDTFESTYWDEDVSEWKGPIVLKQWGVSYEIRTDDRVTLYDRPILPEWALKFGDPPPSETNQYWRFKTRLIGMKDTFEIEKYNLVAKWKSNTVHGEGGAAKLVGISKPGGDYFPAISGDIFDIEVDDGSIYLPLIIK